MEVYTIMADTINIDTLKSNGYDSIKPQKEEPVESGKNLDGDELRDFGNGLKEFDPTANGFKPVQVERGISDEQKALNMLDKQLEDRQNTVRKYNELLDQYGGSITEEELRHELGQDYVTQMLGDGATPEEKAKLENERLESANIMDSLLGRNEPEISDELKELEDELEDDYMPDYTANNNSGVQDFVDPNLARARRAETADTSKETVNEEKVVAETPTPVNDEPKQNFKKEEDTTAANDRVVPNTVSGANPIPNVNIENPDTSHVSGGNIVSFERKESTVDDNGISQEDRDLAELDKDTTEDDETDDSTEKLKAELAKKMRPVSQKFDLSSAVVSVQPITVSNVLNSIEATDRRTFTWALVNSKRPITIKAFTATELNNMSRTMNNRSRNNSRDTFKTIWDHIIGDKGKDFETWTKCTAYADVNHIWFAVYGACFGGTNYIPYTCDSCDDFTITNDVPLENMCFYKNDEAKATVQAILDMPVDTAMSNTFAEYRVQISDNIVIGFREPSIYDLTIAPAMFDSEFTNKYSDIIGYNAYIANIYFVTFDGGRVTLRPIACKAFPGNEIKTAKAKIIQYAKIIRSLPSDQYNVIISHIAKLSDTEILSYGMPAITCDHCHKEIPEQKSMAADLVFTRHQLGMVGA
jgi:hypothetical protein